MKNYDVLDLSSLAAYAADPELAALARKVAKQHFKPGPRKHDAISRPRQHLIDAGKLYPDAWKCADCYRADRGRGGLPDWPDWCYLPLAAAYAVVSGGGPNRVPLHQLGDVGRLGALMAWRVTQGVYRFDPALYERIIETPVDGDIPHEVLYRMPEWCVYVETPGMQYAGAALHGYFAHLEWDANHGNSELRLVLDADAALAPIPLHLGPWSLDESIRRMLDTASMQAPWAGLGALRPGVTTGIRELVEPLVSLLLYLCTEAAEIGNGSTRPANPAPKRTKKGLRMFAPDGPTTWDVGVRLGAVLRSAYHAAETAAGGGTHAGPRPHIRRAHWHTFLAGPGRSERRLKWLSPMFVNVADADPLPAVVRRVT